jgi:hypothetical protein
MLIKVALAGVLATAIALAQGRGGMGDDMGGGAAGMGGMGGGRGGAMGGRGNDMGSGVMTRRASRAELFADKLKLSKEQREETQQIVSAAMERALAVRTQMDQQRARIAGAIIDGKAADEIHKLTADYAASSVQLTGIEADTFGKIWASLKPNQQQKADQAFELLAGMFMSLGGRGRGMGRGAGR